ncbi:hypothetical protein ACFQ0D_32675, partial [Micromonospora zhanjiangensis]
MRSPFEDPPSQPVDEPFGPPDIEPPPRSSAGRSTRQDLTDTTLLVIAVVAGALSNGWPETRFQWMLLALAALVTAVAPHTPLRDYLRERAGRGLRG